MAIAEAKRRRLESIFRTVLKDVKPDAREIEMSNRVSNEIMERVRRAVPKSVEVILAGSVARGTQTSGNSDIDIFLLFPRSMTKERMEREGMRIAKALVNRRKGETYVIKYAEHPYLQLMLRDPPMKADIVPAFKIRDSFEMGSSVDRTQLHNEFVIRNLTARQRDEVRLLKSFMRFHNIYGAEAEREGFSGYLCELLIHHYGSLLSLLEGMSAIRLPICIDPKTRKAVGDSVAFKKFNSDFVVVDPTDPDRNVAAVVSRPALARLALMSRKLLEQPSLRFFYGPEFSDVQSGAKLRRVSRDMGADMYALAFKTPDISRDIVWQQLKKLSGRLSRELEKSSFGVLMNLYNMGEGVAITAFFLNRQTVSSVIRHGPEVFMRSACEAFVKQHRLVFVGDGRLFAIEKAQYDTAKALLLDELRRGDLPSYIGRKGARLYVNALPERHAKLIYRKYVELTSL